MKPSFLKFLNFQKKLDLKPHNIEALHKLLFQSALKQQIDIVTLSSKMGIATRLSKKIFIALVDNDVLKIETVKCNHCSEELHGIQKICPNCSEEVDINIFYAIIDAIVDTEQFDLIQAKSLEIKKATAIVRAWDKNKYLSYVLIDLVDSENVQNILGDQDYKIFFDEIRNIVKYYSLSSITGSYIILGEIGDCIKIAFTKKIDVITFFSNFSQELDKRTKSSEVIKKYVDKLPYFPKFSGIVDLLELPSTDIGFISPKSIVSITLDGSIDFNSKSLTGLFRLDGGAKVNNELAFQNSNVSLWMSDTYIKNTEYESQPIIEIEVGKHAEMMVKRKVALLLLNKGVKKKVDDVEQFYKFKKSK